MKKTQFLIIIIVFSSVLGCNKDSKQETGIIDAKLKLEKSSDCPKYISDQKENNLNVSILLDLSDRIENTKVKEKDSAYLSSLSRAFVNHVKTKKLILLEDRMQLFFNPEPTDNNINKLASKLKIVFTKNTAKSQIEETVTLYKENPSKLYDLAKADAQIEGGYPGSDIWRFFKDDVSDYCIDACHRNILVVLTDGYMYHEKSVIKENNRTSYITPKSLDKLPLNHKGWKEEIGKKDFGFIPVKTQLDDLEVLVIGVTSHNDKNPYALDIIEAYWSKWFDEMGIKKYKIKNAGIPSSIDKVITDFLSKT